MTGHLLVDRVDVAAVYGVAMTAGGLNSVLSWPPLKTPPSNDWQEDDGLDLDLTAPMLDVQEVSLPFVAVGVFTRLSAFMAMLATGSYHRFEWPEIGVRKVLRVVQQSALSYADNFTTFTLKLACDTPLKFDPAQTCVPVSCVAAADDYTLDGVNFRNYGVRVLMGTLGELIRQPDVKPHLLRNISTQPGAVYDPIGTVRFKSREAKINCLARADCIEDLWCNMSCLLRDLTKPGQRLVGITAIDSFVACHYKSCTVSEFFADKRPWLKFSVTVVVTQPVHGFDDEVVIATESGAVLTTQSTDSAINVLPTSNIIHV